MDTRSVNIRYATREDGPMIANLSRQTFYETFASANTKEDMDKFMNEQFTYERLVKEVGAAPNIFIIAEVMEEVAGYAKLREGETPEGLNGLPAIEIARIYSVQGMIGKGVGNALMKKCVEIAYDMGKRVVWLGVWEKNERAIRFYNKWGFEKFAEQDFILGNDLQRDWVMKKVLEGVGH